MTGDPLDEIERLTRELTAARERIADWHDDARHVLAEECAPDERHCSCVPHLRADVERLRSAALEAIRAAWRSGYLAATVDAFCDAAAEDCDEADGCDDPEDYLDEAMQGGEVVR